MSCSQFELDHIAKLQALLTAYLDAITALLVGGVREYRLSTGQGDQMVKREDVSRLQETYGLVWQQYDALSARCNGGGAVQLVPWGAAPWLRF
jgi:hypothetical protein